jgi:hypothetical protein
MLRTATTIGYPEGVAVAGQAVANTRRSPHLLVSVAVLLLAAVARGTVIHAARAVRRPGVNPD